MNAARRNARRTKIENVRNGLVNAGINYSITASPYRQSLLQLVVFASYAAYAATFSSESMELRGFPK